MWPLDLPAREVLRLPGETPIAWAFFDPAWYQLTYPVEHIPANEPAALLRYYLERGQRLGHSPNRLFDEAWHRRVYPQINARIADGHYASAFDAYCRRGSMDRSPHWLFDELGYRERNRDVTPQTLVAADLANGYDHYLRHGSQENRIGHVLFDPGIYLANFAVAEIPEIHRQGVFQHYLERVERGETELPTSIYFDPEWYLQRYQQVAAAIGQGEWKSALHHYLCNDTPLAFDPLDAFSEAHYLERDPGLRQVIEARHFRNGYMHFLGFGARELRSPMASIDLARYAAQPSVRADLDKAIVANAFAHWLTIGRHRESRAIVPPDEKQTLFHHAAVAFLPIAGRFGYDFECPADPVASVVMVVRDRFATTLATIASLRANIAENLELILVDCGSIDETRAIGSYLPGARVLRFESDIGWTHAANAGSQLATGMAILFLANEAQLAPGAVEHACQRLHSDANIGAVGGMIIQPQGVIGQAGGILWNDGETHDYMRGESPLAPEANFVRSVDFCTTAFLLVRAALFTQLEGFDHECAATGDYAGIDLCARINQAGSRVVYDPSLVLFHDQHHDNRGAPGQHFLRKHQSALHAHHAPGDALQIFARHKGSLPPRLLFIEDTIPLRRIGSGFVRSNDLIKLMAGLGCQVTVYPVNGCPHDPAHVFSDMPDTAEVMHNRALDQLRDFILDRTGYYDVIWVARAHNLQLVHQALTQLLSADAPRPLIVLDTEAVAPLRKAEQARLEGQPFDLDMAMQAAFTNSDICDAVVAVTAEEAAMLQGRGLPQVSVIGHMIEPRPTLRPHAQRAGILFVGAIHTMDSPNLDSLAWFVDAVLPLVEETLGWETRLTIAGYTGPGVDLQRFEEHPRITLRGTVANLEPLYNAHRLFVAPTRYAAGLPYKVFEAAARGLPVVATELLRRQLGWTAEDEILAADVDDPTAFATAVISLYRDEAQWRTIRQGALRRLRRDHGQAAYVKALQRVLTTRGGATYSPRSSIASPIEMPPPSTTSA